MGQIELATTVWPAGLRGKSLTTLTAEILIAWFYVQTCAWGENFCTYTNKNTLENIWIELDNGISKYIVGALYLSLIHI